MENINIFSMKNRTSFLAELVILLLLFGDKSYSATEKILFFEPKYQIKLCQLVTEYIDPNKTPSYIIIKSLYGLNTKISILESKLLLANDKIKGLKEKNEALQSKLRSDFENSHFKGASIITNNDANHEQILDSGKKLKSKFFNGEFTTESQNGSLLRETICEGFSEVKGNGKLTDQDYCKIILKKDYIISQLQSLLDEKSYGNNSNNEQLEYYKATLNEMKAKHDEEFELIAGSLYNLGLNFFTYKEKVREEKMQMGWLERQKNIFFSSKDVN